MDKPVISTISSAIPALIVAHPSGVVYNHQAGGYACNHPEMEGVFIPLDDFMFYKNGRCRFMVNIVKELNQYFTGKKHGGWCYEGIDSEDGKYINGLLPSCIRVDSKKLSESMEAWIWVKIKSSDNIKDSFTATWHGFPDKASAVLIWENSD